MNQRESVIKYCFGAKELAIAFIPDGEKEKVFKRNVTIEQIQNELTNEDYNNIEIYRSVEYDNGDVLFIYDIDVHHYTEWKNKPELGIYHQLQEVKKIHKIFGDVLAWKFTGRGMQGTTKIKLNHIILEKFGTIHNFCKSFKKYLDGVIDHKYKGDTQFMHSRGIVRCIGSINLKSKLTCIPMNPNMNVEEIIKRSKNKTIYVQDVVPPTFHKIINWINVLKPEKIIDLSSSSVNSLNLKKEIYELYPQCIKNQIQIKIKGHAGRFDLFRFCNKLYGAKKAYNLCINKYFSEIDKYKVLFGNDKRQFENVKPFMPTCNRMKNRGLCDGKCNRKYLLEGIK